MPISVIQRTRAIGFPFFVWGGEASIFRDSAGAASTDSHCQRRGAQDDAGSRFDLDQARSKLFLQMGLDGHIRNLPVGQITCRRRKLVQYQRADPRLLAVSRQKPQWQWQKGTPLSQGCRQRSIRPLQTRTTLAAKQPLSTTPPTDFGDRARTKLLPGRFEQAPR